VIALSLSVQELLPPMEEELAAPAQFPLHSGAGSGTGLVHRGHVTCKRSGKSGVHGPASKRKAVGKLR
jgi:hypothetical protein